MAVFRAIIFYSLILFSVIVFGQEQQQHVFSIYFKVNSDLVSAEAMQKIRSEILEIGTSNIREIKIRGHADSDAADTFNIHLSKKRAASTKNYLTLQGVPLSIITIEALGETEPISEIKSLNRRAEITLVYDYLFHTQNQADKKYVVKGRVVNFNSGRTLATNFVIEDQKLNIFQSTKADGLFMLSVTPNRNIAITFSKENFLSQTLLVDKGLFKNLKNDTLYLEVKLKPIVVVEKIVFENIFFFSDSDSLKPESQAGLLKLFDLLNADKTLCVEIQGHMSCPISRPMNFYQKRYNHELSHKRARTVYRYLLKKGIPGNQLTFKGMGNSNMIFPEPQNEKEADKNKRVEVWKLKIVEKE